MFIEYLKEKTNQSYVNESDNPLEIIRSKAIKIRNEIYRKHGIELVFFSIEDAISAMRLLKSKGYKTSIRDANIFIPNN